MKTKIEYATHSWNPVVGCKRQSPGCDHCYAERMARRIRTQFNKYHNVADSKGWTGHINFDTLELNKLKHWTKKPRRVFICDMGDLFYKGVPFEIVQKVLFEAARNPIHRYLVLTKRPTRMRAFFDVMMHRHPVPPQFWIGTTVENQKAFDIRIRHLASIPAAIRWLSVEPMLGPVNIEEWRTSIHWVVCGGESGPGARPMNPDWVRDLRNQCVELNIPFFFKQWGIWGPVPKYNKTPRPGIVTGKCVSFDNNNTLYKASSKKYHGNLLDDKRWEAYPNGY